jgi:hypothetical protein
MTALYEFVMDDQARAFCDEIATHMLRDFGVSQAEAIGRINRQWRGVDFGDEDLRYHETAEFWAYDIYYGASSYWWKKPAGLTPLPYP